MKHIQGFMNESEMPHSMTYKISLEMLSTDKLKTYILSLPDKFTVLQDNEFLVHSYNRRDLDKNFDLYLIQEFSDALKMRISPQKGVIVGLQFDSIALSVSKAFENSTCFSRASIPKDLYFAIIFSNCSKLSPESMRNPLN